MAVSTNSTSPFVNANQDLLTTAKKDLLAGMSSSTLLRFITILAVTAGCILRCTQFAADRSLFLDEVYVATNIVQRDISQLLLPLEHDQRAPAGFLIAVKLCSNIFGASDMSLRLVPLLSGILATMVFPFVARRLSQPAAATFASTLFALAPTLVFFSSDLKQYSTDALVTLLLLACVPMKSVEMRSLRRWCGFGVIGATAIWFSFPSLFVIGSVASVGVLLIIHNRDWAPFRGLVMAGLLMAVSFAALYYFQLRHFASEPSWKEQWSDSFFPLFPRSSNDLLWLYRKIHELATVPTGLGFSGVVVSLLVVAIYQLCRTRPLVLSILLGPILVTLAASAARVYPFGGRVITFLAPIVFLLVAEGLFVLARFRQREIRILLCSLVLFVVFDPLHAAARHLMLGKLYTNGTFPDYHFEESKAAMRFIRDHWQSGDKVYLYSDARHAFAYYSENYGFDSFDSIPGIQSALMKPQWSEIEADLGRLAGRRRVWIFFTHVWRHNDVDDRKLYLYFLDRMGKRLDAYESEPGYDAWAYLYDMSASREVVGRHPEGNPP